MKPLPAALPLALMLLASPAALAHKDDEGRRILPNEEELEELGALAERWMRDLTGKLAPMAERLKALVDDIDRYEAPEMLPNGDIIIRRRPDAPEIEAPEDEGEGVAL